MKWETPAFVEINMSAEIGGYQTDFDDDREPAGPRVPRAERARAAESTPRARRAKPPRAHPRPRFGGGRRFPAVELWLRELRRRARRGSARVRPRTQESVAVSGDGESWFLINCSPEIRAQIESFDGLWPRAKRHSPIAGIFLTNGDLDHCLGLLSLRESHPLVVHATDAVRAGFTEGNVLYRTLARFPEQVTWRRLELGREQALGGDDGRAACA